MKQAIALSIHNGTLTMPNIEGLRKQTDKATYHQIEKMFSAMWARYLAKGANTPISLPYWAQQINNPKAMNIALKLLSDNNWIYCSTLPNNNWSEAYLLESKLLTYVDKASLDSIRSYYKFSKYQLKREEPATNPNLTKVQHRILNTGITAEGFTAEGNVPFQFDTAKLYRYKSEAIALINKGIIKTLEQYPELARDHANYGEVAKLIVNNYILDEGTYTSGQNTTDPRGRNNSGYLNKIGNPVGYKVMRSLLTIPEEYRNIATQRGAKNIYLYIAELHGFKKGTKSQKMLAGMKYYITKQFLNLDLSNEDDLDKLYENIWLERLYDELDAYKANKGTHRWSTPIEIDMSALTK